MRIREKLIDYQNKAEANFNHRKSISTTTHYIVALFIFIFSTMVAGFSMPFRLLIKSVFKKKGLLLISEMTNQNRDKIMNTKDLVLLDFWAEWCGPCVMMNPVLKDFTLNSKDVKIVKVNADSNKEIIDEYAIRGLPQFVLVKEGVEIKRHAGPMTLSDLNKFCSD